MAEKKRIKTKLKVGDEVIVISGKNRKQRGEILALSREGQRAIVQGVNMRRRFAPPSQENPKGGIVEREAPVHLSNLMYYDSKAKKGSRIKIDVDKNGNKIRVAASSGKAID